jgi:cytochrome oxidase Cu insertion factor (SCO1/SenC/PrrC family)
VSRPAWLAGMGVAFLATVALAAPDWSSLNIQPYDAPKPAPAFALPGIDGKETRLSDLSGKVVLVFFWATW